jgi:hypothetical protein
MRNGWTRAWWFGGLLVGLAGCGSSLPEHARPTGSTHSDMSVLANADEIPYRQLTREDFTATEPPPHLDGFAKRIGALTCAHVRTSRDSMAWTEPRSSGFESRMTRLRFMARMDRNCSWWNPEPGSYAEAYILQHEQIHFAIIELEARRLQAQVPELKRDLVSSGATRQESEAKLKELVADVFRESLERTLDRSLEFDEDTSGKHATAVQKQWYEDVMRELEETGGLSAML